MTQVLLLLTAKLLAFKAEFFHSKYVISKILFLSEYTESAIRFGWFVSGFFCEDPPSGKKTTNPILTILIPSQFSRPSILFHQYSSIFMQVRLRLSRKETSCDLEMMEEKNERARRVKQAG